MWTETSRPECLADVLGQEHITDRLQFMLEKMNGGIAAEVKRSADHWPHLMFAGPPGTGKTTTAIALMKTAFGDEWDLNWLELNASDERSIKTIREKVKEFARRGVIGDHPFNVVFLDEADALTPDAQGALRRIMEKHPQTRFILSCNYPHKLIPAIKDRCAFSDARFHPIELEVMDGVISELAVEHEFTVADGVVNLIHEASGGSLRKAINLLYAASRVPGATVTEVDIEDVAVTVTPRTAKKLLKLVIKANDMKDTTQYLTIHRDIDAEIEDMAQSGLSGVEILDAFYTLAIEDDMPVSLSRQVFEHLAEAIYMTSTSQNDLLSVKTFLRRITL